MKKFCPKCGGAMRITIDNQTVNAVCVVCGHVEKLERAPRPLIVPVPIEKEPIIVEKAPKPIPLSDDDVKRMLTYFPRY